MNKFLSTLIFILTSIVLNAQTCTDSITSTGIYTIEVSVVVYNSSNVIIDTLICHKQNNGGNSPLINCDLSNYEIGSYYSLTICSGGSNNCVMCLYDYQGNLVMGTLPIELIEFIGYTENGLNKIQWSTSTEINNDYFELERSEDGYLFTKIEKIKGAGNSSVIVTYSYTDKNPFSDITYYRLKQVDFDGQFEYHNIIAIQNIHNNNSNATIYPNPSNNHIKIGGMDLKDIERISIFNSIGQKVYESEIYEDGIDISELDNGIYFVLINENDNIIRKTITKN